TVPRAEHSLDAAQLDPVRQAEHAVRDHPQHAAVASAPLAEFEEQRRAAGDAVARVQVARELDGEVRRVEAFDLAPRVQTGQPRRDARGPTLIRLALDVDRDRDRAVGMCDLAGELE